MLAIPPVGATVPRFDSFVGMELVPVVGATLATLLLVALLELALWMRRSGRLDRGSVLFSGAWDRLSRPFAWGSSKVQRLLGGRMRDRDGEGDGKAAVQDVGSRIDQILKAADDAAEQIKAEAREAADAARREAEAAVAARLEEAERECEKLRAETENSVRDVRAAGDAYAAQRRRESDEEAARVLRETQQHARATREAAEVMAKQIESEARARIHELEERGRSIEARLQRVLITLRETSSTVEEVLIGRPGEAKTPLEGREVESRSASPSS